MGATQTSEKKFLVRLRGEERVTYEKTVEMTESELNDLKRAYNTGDGDAIDGSVGGWLEGVDPCEGDGIEDVEAYVVEKQADGKEKVLETLYSGEDYDVGTEGED